MSHRLDVHLEGVEAPVGQLTGSDDRALRFRYSAAAQDRGIAISLSMPVHQDEFGDAACRAYFENLLNENNQMEQVMALHGIDRDDVAGLLFHLGRDCPGAISCVPEGEGPAKQPGRLNHDYEPLPEDRLVEIMRSLRDHRRLPNPENDPSPLAGVQGKVALARLENGQFALPALRDGKRLNVPTTHILKVPERPDFRLVDQEAALLRAAASVLPHPVAEAEPFEADGVPGLLIRRFDRSVRDGEVHRLHQEDFAQALGLPPFLKYERASAGADRIFSAARVAELIDRTRAPAIARRAFLMLTLFNLAVGNTDNHAKNHALLYSGDYSEGMPAPILAPLYDVVPVLLDTGVTHEFAFRIGAARFVQELSEGDLAGLATDLGYPRLTARLRRDLEDMLARLTEELHQLPNPAFKRLKDMAFTLIGDLDRFGLQIQTPDHDLFPLPPPA